MEQGRYYIIQDGVIVGHARNWLDAKYRGIDAWLITGKTIQIYDETKAIKQGYAGAIAVYKQQKGIK
jgi:hypothetical protein